MATPETVERVFAKIHFMVPIRDVQGLGQFTRAGAKAMDVSDFTASSHHGETAPRLERADQDKPASRATFYEHIEHPMHPIIHVNVGRAGLVSLDKRARARPRERVTSFVMQGQICLGFHHNPRASPPDQLGAYKLARAKERIALEKRCTQDQSFYVRHSNTNEKMK